MKTLIVLSLVLPFCLTIEVKLQNLYGNAIKKVEIPSCKSEPCPLVKGVPLDISITVESKYPPEKQFKTVSDLETYLDISMYRGKFVYLVAKSQFYCKQYPNDCPLNLNKLYTIKRQVFLSTDKEGGAGNNGKTITRISVLMMEHGAVGTMIGHGSILLDIKAN